LGILSRMTAIREHDMRAWHMYLEPPFDYDLHKQIAAV
jgi:hypothetical protein